jgi:hypothetical protein
MTEIVKSYITPAINWSCDSLKAGLNDGVYYAAKGCEKTFDHVLVPAWTNYVQPGFQQSRQCAQNFSAKAFQQFLSIAAEYPVATLVTVTTGSYFVGQGIADLVNKVLAKLTPENHVENYKLPPCLVKYSVVALGTTYLYSILELSKKEFALYSLATVVAAYAAHTFHKEVLAHQDGPPARLVAAGTYVQGKAVAAKDLVVNGATTSVVFACDCATSVRGWCSRKWYGYVEIV